MSEGPGVTDVDGLAVFAKVVLDVEEITASITDFQSVFWSK